MLQIIFLRSYVIAGSYSTFINNFSRGDVIISFSICKYNYMYNKTLFFITNSWSKLLNLGKIILTDEHFKRSRCSFGNTL